MKTTLQQLSIFLENKIGTLRETMDILNSAGIRTIASMVADTTEFGILRLITDDNERAYELLRSAHKNTNRSEVIAVAGEEKYASFNEVLKVMGEQGVTIEYMYSFSVSSKAVMIMRVSDTEKALEIAMEHKFTTLSNEDIAAL